MREVSHSHDCPVCDKEVLLTVFEGTSRLAILSQKLASVQKCGECINRETLEQIDRERSRHINQLERRIASSGIPKGLQELTFDQMRTELGRGEVIEAVRSWLVTGGSFFLYARPGPGKTRLAATAAWSLVQSRPVKFVQAAVLITRANASFGTDHRDMAESMVLGIEPLFLDDLGKESATPFATTLLQAALDERIANGTHLFITSNLQANELGAKYGDWLASRLGAMEQWHLPGPDMRLEL